MNAYRVTIGQRNAPRLSFEAMCSDSCTCVTQHLGLCGEGERVEVVSLAELAEQSNDNRAMQLQQRAADVQDAINRRTAE